MHKLDDIERRRYEVKSIAHLDDYSYVVASKIQIDHLSFSYYETPLFIRHYDKMVYLNDKFKDKVEAADYVVNNISHGTIVLLGFNDNDMDYFTSKYFAELV